MSFWSGVKNEYNEIFDDDKEQYIPEGPKLEEEFEDLIADIKDDVKQIPKNEVWPEFPDAKKTASDEDNDDAYDMEKVHKAMEEHAASAKKQEKRCRVNGKFYGVGERWTDEKTGKDMICILMNIPKEIQPMLDDADVMVTTPEPKPVEAWTRPSVEPEWQYTANPKRKSGKKRHKTSSKKTNNNPNSDEEKECESNEEEVEGRNEHEESEGLAEDQLKEEQSQEEEDATSEEDEPPDGEKQVSEDEEEGAKEENEEEAESGNESDYSLDKDRKPKTQEQDEEEDDDETDSEDEDKPTPKGSNRETIDKTTNKKENEDPDEGLDVDEPYENAEEEEEEVKHDNKFDKPEEIAVSHQQNSNVKFNKTKKQSQPSQKTRITEPVQTNESEPSSSESQPPQEKGQTIYMKETITKRRRLIKTEETIETTETDKN